jgi:hypothetical protein
VNFQKALGLSAKIQANKNSRDYQTQFVRKHYDNRWLYAGFLAFYEGEILFPDIK